MSTANTASTTALAESDLVLRRSLPVRAARAGLRWAARNLPKSAYDVLYRVGFSAYRTGIRAQYRAQTVGVPSSDFETRAMRELVHRAMKFSLVGSGGLEATYAAAATIIKDDIPGCFVECGVAEGGCAGLMATLATREQRGRKMWLFDSFEGLPEPTNDDYADGWTGEHVRPLPKGSCLGTIERVNDVLFNQFGADRDSVVLVKGWFQDTLAPTRTRLGPIAILRIDGDWYESTKCCLESLYDQVVPGGYCIVDDYGVCAGCKKAVDEFLTARGENVGLVSDGRGGVLLRRPLESHA